MDKMCSSTTALGCVRETQNRTHRLLGRDQIERVRTSERDSVWERGRDSASVRTGAREWTWMRVSVYYWDDVISGRSRREIVMHFQPFVPKLFCFTLLHPFLFSNHMQRHFLDIRCVRLITHKFKKYLSLSYWYYATLARHKQIQRKNTLLPLRTTNFTALYAHDNNAQTSLHERWPIS